MAGTDSGVYRVTEIVGTSDKSWEEAAKNAVETAAASLRDLRIAEVTKLDCRIEKAQHPHGRVDHEQWLVINKFQPHFTIGRNRLARSGGPARRRFAGARTEKRRPEGRLLKHTCTSWGRGRASG